MSSAPANAGEPAVDLRTLVAHAHAVAVDATVESVHADFARRKVDFLAVLDGPRLLGVCARRELAEALGSRFGFALNARRSVREHLMAAPLCQAVDQPLTDVFKSAAARGDREFYDDVLLVDAEGRYLGMIPMRTLVRLQTGFLLGNIAHLENSRQEIAEKNRQMEEDLRMAREVQLALLPAATPPLAAAGGVLRIAHRYRPAGEMSGDFFAVLHPSAAAAGLLVCDVMGHGVRSALVTAMVRAMLEELRAVAGEPGRLLTALNRDLTRLLRQAGGLIFVTAAYAVVDLAAGTLRYAQAGHPSPLRWDAAAQRVRAIACDDAQAGPALGLIDDFEYAECAEPFVPGDRVLLFTDGLTEARTPAGEEFGEGRLAAVLATHAAADLEAWLGAVLAAAGTFAGDRFDDDVCLVAAGMTGPGT